MEQEENIIDITIDCLEHWKEQFFSNLNKDEVIQSEVYDYLDGIEMNEIKCFASHLFKLLSESDKKEILKRIDFDVNFEKLYAIYYI